MTVAVRWSVVDPVAYTSAMDAEGVVYLGVQVALREQLAGQDASELVRTGRRATTDALLDAARLAAAEVGIDVVAVVIKDIMLPADLRAAYSELVASRQPARPSSRWLAPRVRHCGRWPTRRGCSTSIRRWPGSGWSRRRRMGAS